MLDIFANDTETIAGVGRQLRDRRRMCVDVLEGCLARIDEWEPRVHAWVLVDREGAMAQARARDDELAAGQSRGPLHGIPIGIKDIIDVAGMPTACGSKLRAGEVAAEDAGLVALLRQAGAVILGKTVTTPFAWIDPPPTRNPWALDRTPGGSSSGSAAAVACGMALGAIGTQTGGSITRPASFCGVAGCKPSHGSVSVRGVFPFAAGLDHPGPIARTVADLAILLHPLIGLPLPGEAHGHLGPIDRSPRPRPRLGRLRGLFEERAEPAMLRAFNDAMTVWESAGAETSEPPLPVDFPDAIAIHRAIMAAEAAGFHETRFREHPDDYPPRIHDLLIEGLAMPASAYVQCQERRANLAQRVHETFHNCDVLVTPAALGPAPGPETTGDPVFNAPWSLFGLPTVSFPVGLSPEGLPLAVQLIGRRDREGELFDAALWCEDAIRSAHRPRRD